MLAARSRISLLCVALLGATTEAENGFFYIMRDPSTCTAIEAKAFSENPSEVASAATDADSSETCLYIDGTELVQMKAYTTFILDGVSIEARLGPLNVINSDPRLSYECPPDMYNGFDYRYSYCQTENNNTMLAVAYVSTEANNMLLNMDVILSGAPFPQDLSINDPPFGAARYSFDAPIPMMNITTGTLALCPGRHSVTCPGVNAEETLDLKGLVFSGFGSFRVEGLDYESPAVWIHDDNRQLLHLTAGDAQGFWFNASGYFFVDFEQQSCVWLPNCNFACEVYNYDSRFLDYIGTWDITGKVGSSDFEPTTAKVYLGNAIDAAGVFPCLMYIAVDGGYYLGLDKLDTTVGTGGSSFWYSRIDASKPDFTEYPLPLDLNCSGTMEEWLLPVEGGGDGAPTASPENSAGPSTSVCVVLSAALAAGFAVLNTA